MTEVSRLPSPSFVVVGSCIVDLCMTVERLPRPGETVLASGYTRSLGGKGANQATALRRLGGEVALVACLGDDEAGAAFLELFAREGVDARYVHRDPSAATGHACPMVLPDGNNAIVAAPAASMRLPVAAVSAARGRIQQADALLLQLEIPRAAAAAAMAIARQEGVPVFLNPAPAEGGALDLARTADVLIPNQLEAESLTGLTVRTPDDALRAAERLRAAGPTAVVVTLGEHGAVVSAPGEQGLVPASPVEAVDTTGAGDAFCAGFVYARSRGAGWLEAARFAAACGALACRRAGAIPALPTRAEAEALAARSQGAV